MSSLSTLTPQKAASRPLNRWRPSMTRSNACRDAVADRVPKNISTIQRPAVTSRLKRSTPSVAAAKNGAGSPG